MPFEYEKPAAVEGDWVNMRDMAKLGEAVTVANGFLTDDPNNTYNGEPLPRYIVAGKVASTGDPVKTGCTKGYGRDDFLQALDKYLKEHPTETVDIKYIKTAGSQYIDITTAD